MGFKAGSGNTGRIQENLSFIVFRSHQSTIVTLKTVPSCVITDMNAKRGRPLLDGPVMTCAYLSMTISDALISLPK